MQETFKISSKVKIVWAGAGLYYRKPVKNWDDVVTYRKVKGRTPPKGTITQEFTDKPDEYIYLESGYSSIVCGTR